MDLTITTAPDPEKYVVAVGGEIDISNADRLREACELALAQPCEAVALDFSQVPYIDSTGIGVLVGAAHAAASAHRGFSVEHARPDVLRIVQLLGVDKEFPISGE